MKHGARVSSPRGTRLFSKERGSIMKAQQQQQSPLDMGGGVRDFADMKGMFIGGAEIVALTVRIFIHTCTGYQRLALSRLCIMFVVLLALNWIGNFSIGVPMVGIV